MYLISKLSAGLWWTWGDNGRWREHRWPPWLWLLSWTVVWPCGGAPNGKLNSLRSFDQKVCFAPLSSFFSSKVMVFDCYNIMMNLWGDYVGVIVVQNLQTTLNVKSFKFCWRKLKIVTKRRLLWQWKVIQLMTWTVM